MSFAWVKGIFGIVSMSPNERKSSGDIACIIVEPVHATNGDFFTVLRIDARFARIVGVFRYESTSSTVVNIGYGEEECLAVVIDMATQRIAAGVHAIDGAGEG